MDSIGLSLGLFSSVDMSLKDFGRSLDIEGYGTDMLVRTTNNLVVKSIKAVCRVVGYAPSGLNVRITNNFPVLASMGSSCVAVLGVFVGMNELLGAPLMWMDLLHQALKLEARMSNLLSARFRKLCVAARISNSVTYRNIEVAPWQVCLGTPAAPSNEQFMNTQEPPTWTVSSLSSLSVLFVQALIEGDAGLLREIQDTIVGEHGIAISARKYQSIIAEVQESGSSATFVVGDGPTIVAFAESNHEAIATAMKHVVSGFTNQEAI